MISISSDETYKSIDVLRTMRSLVDQLLEIVNRFQLDESRKLVRSLQALQKRTTVPQLKIAVLSDSQERKNMLIQALLRTSLQDFSFPPLEVTCLYLAFGSEPDCAVTLASGMTARLPVEELTEFVRNNGSASEFKKFLVRIPNEILKAGVILIDTPTLAGAAAGVVPCTEATLQEADACLLVLNDSAEISGSISAFLERAKSSLPKFFVILDASTSGVESAVRDRLEDVGVTESRIIPMPGFGLHPEEYFSGEESLASLRKELMQFARVSSHKSMADELCTLASETLTHTERAAASGRTMMQRAKLRRTAKQVSRICDHTEELLAQTIDALPKTAERRDSIRKHEWDSQQDHAGHEAVVKGVEESLSTFSNAEPSVSAGTLVESAPEVPQPVAEPVTKSSVPAWQHSLRRASHFVPAKATPGVVPHSHFPPQDDALPSSVFARTTNTRDAAALFARQSFTSGAHLLAPTVPPEPSYRASVTAARSEEETPIIAQPVLLEHTAAPTRPTAADVPAEFVAATVETRADSTERIATPEDLPAPGEISAPAADILGLDIADDAKRSRWEEAAMPFVPATEREFQVLGSYGANLGRHDEASHGSAGHIAWRVAAVAAVAACAWVFTIGFQRHQQSVNSARIAATRTTVQQTADDSTRVATSSSHDTLPTSAATPPRVPSPNGSKAGADSANMTGISSPKETAHESQTAIGADKAAAQPNSVNQSASASAPTGADRIPDPSLRLALDRWANSYRSGNVADGTACYAPFVDTYFNQKNMRPEQIARDRQNERSKIASVHEYRVTPLRITDQGNGQQAVLLQKDWNTTTTNGTNYSGSDLEKLTFVKIDNSWKIVEEQEVKVLKLKRG